MRALWISFLLVLQFSGVTQNTFETNLIGEHIENQGAMGNYVPKYMFRDRPFLIKYNPITMIPGGLMYCYQKFISPQIFADCLFEESCSKFSIHLIHEFGFFKGASLSADRLTRCTRLSAEDLSPVRINKVTNRVYDSVNWYKKH